jgi:hypothetical protein
MKKTVQINYSEFAEVFEVNIGDGSLDICLKKIISPKEDSKSDSTLNLASNIKTDYSGFPFKDGDLSIIQIHNVFIVSIHQNGHIHWLRFDTSEILSYLIKHDLFHDIIPYINEDSHLFLNSVLSDMIRSDYSFSDLNKKIKFAKSAILMGFIKDILNLDFRRVILDETVLGDVDIENIAMAFKFSGKKFLGLLKINNSSKVLLALEKDKHLDSHFEFDAEVFFINNFEQKEKFRLILGENGTAFDYEILPQKNYIFDLGQKVYNIDFGDIKNTTVSGKVTVYNGDERDLMIS